MLKYDPEVPPDPMAWGAADVSERLRAVEVHHQSAGSEVLHQGVTRWSLHCRLHMMVEDQIARSEPASTGRAVARLMSEGLRRHPALHAVVRAFAEQMASGAWSDADWDRRMDALSAGGFLGGVMARDLRTRH